MNHDTKEYIVNRLQSNLERLDKYKNLGGVKGYIEEFSEVIDYIKRSSDSIPFPSYQPLPPIAEIPLDELLKEIKRRVEYHPVAIG
jgi:hypothetical protein